MSFAESWHHLSFLAAETARVAMGGPTRGDVAPTGLSRKDVVVLLYACLLNVAVFKVLQRTLFQFLAKLLAGRRAAKFKLAARECTYYFSSLLLVYLCLWVKGEAWLREFEGVYIDDYAMGGVMPATRPEIKFMYLMELSWYVTGMFRLLSEPRKKDFWEMLAHHCITATLLATSWHIGHIKIGVLVWTLHNTSDPILQVAKLCKYIRFEAGATAFFVLFLGLFFWSRLWLYVIFIVKSWAGGPALYRNQPNPHTFVFGGHLTWPEIFCGTLLTALIPIHYFWFYLIARIAQKTVMSGVTDDNRSDSESDEDFADSACAPHYPPERASSKAKRVKQS